METEYIKWALIFFGIAAVIGAYMISRVFRRLPRQTGAMLLHGLFAGFAIGCLFYFSAMETTKNIPYASIFFFVLAVLGGVFMAMWDKIMNRKMPKYFPVMHASAAITGIVLLIIFLFNHR